MSTLVSIVDTRFDRVPVVDASFASSSRGSCIGSIDVRSILEGRDLFDEREVDAERDRARKRDNVLDSRLIVGPAGAAGAPTLLTKVVVEATVDEGRRDKLPVDCDDC